MYFRGKRSTRFIPETVRMKSIRGAHQYSDSRDKNTDKFAWLRVGVRIVKVLHYLTINSENYKKKLNKYILSLQVCLQLPYLIVIFCQHVTHRNAIR